MIKKLTSFILALILMASFYLYALLREDEETKGAQQWVVAESDAAINQSGKVTSTNPEILASTMGASLPLPRQIQNGEVTDGYYHGYGVRLLLASDGQRKISGVSPFSAAPMIRNKSLVFSQSEKTLMSYPLLVAQDGPLSFYYLVTDRAAFVIETPAATSDDAALADFIIAAPQ